MASQDQVPCKALRINDKKRSFEDARENSETKCRNSSTAAKLPATNQLESTMASTNGVLAGIDLNKLPIVCAADYAVADDGFGVGTSITKPHSGKASIVNEGKEVQVGFVSPKQPVWLSFAIARTNAGITAGTGANAFCDTDRAHKRSKLKKGADWPKLAKTAYAIFSAKARTYLNSANHPMAQKPSTLVKSMWRVLPWDQKKPFYEKSKEDRLRYKREVVEYEKKVRPNGTA